MREKKFGRLFLTWLLAATMVLTLLPVSMLAADGEGEATSAGVSGLTVGFKVQMNPKSGAQIDKTCNHTETLDVDLDIYTNVYIRPYLEVDGKVYTPPRTTPWNEHIYYTYEFKDFKCDTQQSSVLPFGKELVYNHANTGHESKTSTIVINELPDERLNNGTPGKGDYYTLTIKAYRSATSGEETLGTDPCLGAVTAKLHVRMTGFALPELDWLDSYWWGHDEYGIERNLGQTYQTANDFITAYLNNYQSTTGRDKTEANALRGIPVFWEVTEGTEYSAEPGTVNSLTWTAELEKAPDYAKWTIPEGFVRSKAIEFQNPFAVRFMNGENVLKTTFVKKGNTVAQADYLELPTKPFYTSAWDREPGFRVEENTDVHAVYTPISYGITYHLDGGTNSPNNPETYTVEDTFPLKAPTKQGYAFTGWTSDGETEPKLTVTIPVGTTGGLVFTAHWVEVATITATADEHGKIDPAGTITVPKGESKTFTITPDPGYHIKDVLVDGKSVGAVSTYTFKEVVADHTIHAAFAENHTPGHPTQPEQPKVEIPDDDALGLNTTDHFAYIIGYPDGTVQPGGQITRAEVATIFFRLLTDDVRDANLKRINSYTDVASNAWYNTAVSTLSSMGIIAGYPDGTFRPNANITRAEFVAIAARFDPNGDKTAAAFSDILNHWAKDEISIAYNNSWVDGYPDGTFLPQRNISRAEAMTLVNRVLNCQPETEDDLLPNMTVWTDNANPKAWYYLAVQEATNSHYYEFKTNSQYEKWTELRETRDGSQLEK